MDMNWLTTASVVYALMVAAGGFMGYRAGSTMSLVMSGTIALLVLGAAALSVSNPRMGFGTVGALALVMIGIMLSRGISTGTFGMPVIGGITLSVIMLLLLVFGHFMAPKADSTPATPPTQEN
jgi:uncharacterized membrane protein (UPF0136 family)